jgi:Protein of unknown function (DUF2891)
MTWTEFEQARVERLHTLAPVILSAVGNDDTASPMFHGCFDWHSAVHGVYSLYAIYNRTGDDLYLEAARQHARPELVAGELGYMRQAWLESEENPYGFAWMLVLVETQELATGGRELRPLADYAVERMTARLAGLDEASAFAMAVNDAYGNLGWALLHLARWARHAGDDALLELARDVARRHLVGDRLDAALPLSSDAGAVLEFMAPGLMRLAALGTVLGDEGRAHVDRLVPAGFTLPPFTEPTTIHGGGVNFFRAFALLHAYAATGRASLAEDVARVFEYQLSRTDLWRAGDYAHRHWIAQIGVRVIDDSYLLAE